MQSFLLVVKLLERLNNMNGFWLAKRTEAVLETVIKQGAMYLYRQTSSLTAEGNGQQY